MGHNPSSPPTLSIIRLVSGIHLKAETINSIPLLTTDSVLMERWEGSIMGPPSNMMNVGGSVATAAASVRNNYDEPQSVSGVGNSVSGHLQSQLDMNLIVPMTPLAGKDGAGGINVTLPPSNIPAFIPATPMTVSQAIDVPSPTLQNIVSTVNLGSSQQPQPT